MENTKQTIEQTMEQLANTIRTAPAEKYDEIAIFLEGYVAGLERVLGKKAS